MNDFTTGRLRTLMICILTLLTTGAIAEQSLPSVLQLDQLYTTPSIIGTPPELVDWSSNGEKIAFRWAEPGDVNEDVWVYSLVTGDRRNLTSHAASKASISNAITAIQWLGNDHVLYAKGENLLRIDMRGQSILITAADGPVDQLRVSPDGRHVSFVSNGGLWLIGAEAEQQDPKLIAAAGEKVAVERYQWSNDGSKLALVVADKSAMPKLTVHYFSDGEVRVHNVVRAFPGDETTRWRIAVYDLTTGRTAWLPRKNVKDPVWSFGWSSDDSSIFVGSSDFLVKQRSIVVYDVESGDRELYYAAHDPNGRYSPAWDAAWAPNGNGLIILSDHEGFYHLYKLPGPDEELIRLTKGEWEVASFTVNADDLEIYFIANRDHIADRQLYRLRLNAGAVIERISTKPGTYEPFYSPDFRRIAYRFSNDGTPPDLYYQRSHAHSEPIRITKSPMDAFYGTSWADVRYVSFPSHIDGTQLFGRLYVPKDFDPERRYPLIVGSVYSNTVRNQWGGRSVHPTWGLDQFLVSRGYLVFSVNIRGSWGQGRAFRNSRKEFGRIDVEDLESGVRHLLSLGYVDPDRIGIWGSSYGGLMTVMSLARNADLYSAGIAGAPATNVWHAFPAEMRVMGEPEGDDYPARYRRQSALYQTSNLEDPLMIVHGSKDTIVLYSDSIAMVERLIAHEKMFELVTIPGAGHHWDANSPEQTLFAYRKMVDFFDRHVGKIECAHSERQTVHSD